MIGKPMAEKLNLDAGDRVGLSVNTADGTVQEQTFTVKGIYTTNTYAFDSATVFLPLAKAQAITQTDESRQHGVHPAQGYEHDRYGRPRAECSSNLEVKTWKDLNALFVEFEGFAQSYIAIFYLIILAISASVIINTLIMSVYERTREIGILSAIGMRGRRILMLFLAEFVPAGGWRRDHGIDHRCAGNHVFQRQRVLYWQHGSERHYDRRHHLRQVDHGQPDQPDDHDLYRHAAGRAVSGNHGFPHATGRSPARRKIRINRPRHPFP